MEHTEPMEPGTTKDTKARAMSVVDREVHHADESA